MTISAENEFTPLVSFGLDKGYNWKNISKANSTTKVQVSKVIEASDTFGMPLSTEDTDLVVFGSLARRECTSKSDADWTMLIDGPSDPNHQNLSLLLKDLMIKSELAEPGQSGMFGQTTSSHTIIHNVGGQDDTNHNLSRRILLLLESEKISLAKESNSSGTAYERTLRGVIHQYIENDSGFLGSTGKDNVPRFLLNDIIRFWKTMCVDFAYKQKQQSEKKWAVRNIKLRMSRKLIFVKGLLMCSASFKKPRINSEEIEENLLKAVQTPALQYVYNELSIFPGYHEGIYKLFSAYDDFLGLLDDDKVRGQLESLSMKEAYQDPTFEKAREISHRFQEALQSIYFITDGPLREFTLKYGVF